MQFTAVAFSILELWAEFYVSRGRMQDSLRNIALTRRL